MSYFDVSGSEPERFYHALILGILVALKDTHIVKSNRESGFGRYDVMIVPYDHSLPGIVIEFKKVLRADNDTLQTAIKKAFAQIDEKNYVGSLQSQGLKKIFTIAMAFHGKSVMIESKEVSGP